ncbi:MAG TPA: Crp/Fnr family transcriptional regulator [Xanthobacteraceae bacterium]|jgi:CRP-like cAMP-binding protein|nr:Crp/Fnr family transcriptional regulator [Xanthobacteraceae bacterium]
MARQTETLARIPLFRSLTEAAVRRLDTQCAWRRAKAKEWILDYKDQSADLYFVVQGHVRVLIQASSGKDSILRDIRDGDFFGELAAIDALPRSAAILAVTDSIVAKMAPPVFRDIVHQHPDVCDQLLILLAGQIRMLANRVNEFGTLDVRTRIYSELLRLARPALNGGRHSVISPPPTHAELAARVSSRREAVTRELNSLARSGLLEKRRGALVLLDPKRLAGLIDKAQR